MAERQSPKEQESMIHAAAIACIAESSLLDFTMAGIAKQAGVSVGTVYKFVQSKEDVLLALGTTLDKQQRHSYGRILGLPLTMAERLIGCFLADPATLNDLPFGIHLDMLLGNGAIVRRASDGWVAKYLKEERAIHSLFADTMAKAWEDGALNSSEEAQSNSGAMLSNLWALNAGFIHAAYRRAMWQDREGGAVHLPFPLATDHPVVSYATILINLADWRQPLTDDGIARAVAALTELGYRPASKRQ